MDAYRDRIEGKKFIFICHGYRNEEHHVIKAYDLIKRNDRRLINYFDVVAGYRPGGENRRDYCKQGTW